MKKMALFCFSFMIAQSVDRGDPNYRRVTSIDVNNKVKQIRVDAGTSTVLSVVCPDG